MKIALITDGIWPYVLGGMQKHSYYLCKYLTQNRIEVDLVHFNQSSYDINKLEFFTEEERKFIHPIIVNFPETGKLPGHYLRRSKEHSRLIFEAIKDKLNSYDFIYTKGFTGWYLIDQKKAGNIKCAKIGVKFHGYEMFQRAPNFNALLQYIFLLRGPVKHISQNADIVFSYGGKITDIIRSIGVEEKKISVLPSGVELSTLADKITSVSGKIKFLFLGRYERRKGIEELNLALQNIKNENFEFHFIGPITAEKKIEGNNIYYHGEIRDKTELVKRIKNCDVLVCPSWSEGMPNVILEAMANGLTVIATNVGATNVLVNERTGWLIESSSPQEIENSLKKVIAAEPIEINTKKQHALDHIKQHFVWENLAPALIDKMKA